MAGFFIGLVWFLISIGNDNSFSKTTSSIHSFLLWWYIVSSVIVFFTIPSAKRIDVAEEISTRFIKMISVPPQQCFGLAMFSFIVSRVLLFVGLSFLGQSAFVEMTAGGGKFVTGAILIFLGATTGVSSMFPMMAIGSLQNGNRI